MNVTTEKSVQPPSRNDQKRAYRHSENGRAKRLEQQTRRRTRQYVNRSFLAWDGEGLTLPGTSEHLYTLFAYGGAGDGKESAIESADGLATVQCLEFMLNSDTRKYINIIYGGNYDVNMWLRDVDRETLEELYNTGCAAWYRYWLEWRPGKQFAVSDRRSERKFRLYDVLPFFQRSFVQACDEYLGVDWEARDQIIAGKIKRGTFTAEESEETRQYNAAELRNLTRLASELRSRLYGVVLPTAPGITRPIVPSTDGLRISRWDGPGAIATALYQKYETKAAIGAIPESVGIAGRHAYAGGRFEIVRQGHSEGRTYQYDINSAYPNAIQHLPCLAHGEWTRRDKPSKPVQFGLYRINNAPITEEHDYQYPLRNSNDWTRPQTLWYRTRNGRIVYGPYTHNWFWSPEAKIGIADGARLEEGWEFIPGCDHKPFAFVPKLYEQRAELKRRKDGAHVGIKLGLNSLYGKLAQQVGWKILPNGTLKIPPYHCLEWAGYITASCRAQLYEAASTAIDDVIAFETDAIFSRVPLDLDIGSGLGQWEETRYASLTYLMSGYYFGTKINDDGSTTEVEKSRGVNKGSVTRSDVIRALAEERGKISATQTRFITLGQALHQDWTKWRQWITAPRNLDTMLNGKRTHALSFENGCHDRADGWEETWPNTFMLDIDGAHTPEVMSKQYDIEWLDNTDYDRSRDRRDDLEREWDD